MAAENVGVAGEGVVGFVDGVAVDDGGSAGDAGLGVDDGVSADDGGVAGDVPGDGEIAEEDEDVAGEVAFDLDGAKETGGVADLLSGSDEDVLAEVGPVGVGMRLRLGGVRVEGDGQEKGVWRSLYEMDEQRLAPFSRVRRGAQV